METAERVDLAGTYDNQWQPTAATINMERYSDGDNATRWTRQRINKQDKAEPTEGEARRWRGTFEA